MNHKITAKSKADLVVEHFINSLMKNEFKPGDRLPVENELATKYGVSRVTIREAFKKLSLMGIVNIQGGKGTFVCQPTIENYMDPLLPVLIFHDEEVHALYEARSWIESGIAAVSAKNATNFEIEQLKEIYGKMVESFDIFSSQDPVYSSNDKLFHDVLAESSHNVFLIKTYKTIINIYNAFIDKTGRTKSGRKASLAEHQRILNAIASRDFEGAEQAMREHIEMAYQLYLNGEIMEE